MSRTTTDDALVDDLRRLTSTAVPPMGLDTGAVLQAGRRHRSRSLAIRTGGGVLAVAAAAVVTASLLAGPPGAAPVAPAGPDSQSHDATTLSDLSVETVWMPPEFTPDPRSEEFGKVAYDLGLTFPAGTFDERPTEVVLTATPTTLRVGADDPVVDAVDLELWAVRDGGLFKRIVSTTFRLDGSGEGQNLALADGLAGYLVAVVSVPGPEHVTTEIVGADGATAPVPLLTLAEAPAVGFGLVVTGPDASPPVELRRTSDNGEYWATRLVTPES